MAGVSLSESEREREWVCSAEGKLLEGEGGGLQNKRNILGSTHQKNREQGKMYILVISPPPSATCSTSG